MTEPVIELFSTTKLDERSPSKRTPKCGEGHLRRPVPPKLVGEPGAQGCRNKVGISLALVVDGAWSMVGQWLVDGAWSMVG